MAETTTKDSRIISILITHWGMNEQRSEIMRKSLLSLLPTIKKLPVELIVVDNGENFDDSQFLLAMAHNGEINTYIRNHKNLSFGYARNQALRVCNGDFIAVCDNDIRYYGGWLESCLKVLDAHPDKKIWATPVYNVAHWLPKYWSNEVLEVDEEIYKLNSRAGSNCWVMRRKDFEEVGEFLIHRVAGTKWTEEAIQKGYLGAVTPKLMVDDMSFREGYQINKAIPIKETLSNGEEVYYNQDEFKSDNGGLNYSREKRFNPKARIRFQE